MMNLLKETIDKIQAYHKEISDIVYIGDGEGSSCTWDEFTLMANREYDDGYGGAEVLTSLKIVFDDNTWLERGEYDGSEWWNYMELPNVKADSKLTNLFEIGY
jgi:hypothetical protein